MKPLAEPPRTRFGAAHLELHRLALVQAPEPVGKQVTLRRRTASVGRTSSRAVVPLARLVHKYVLAAVAARDEPCGVGENKGVSTGDAAFTAQGECSAAACSATALQARAHAPYPLVTLNQLTVPVMVPSAAAMVQHSPRRGLRSFCVLHFSDTVSAFLAHAAPAFVDLCGSVTSLCESPRIGRPCGGHSPSIRRWLPGAARLWPPRRRARASPSSHPPHSSALKLASL